MGADIPVCHWLRKIRYVGQTFLPSAARLFIAAFVSLVQYGFPGISRRNSLKFARGRPCCPLRLNVVAERTMAHVERTTAHVERTTAHVERSKMASGAHGFWHLFGVEFHPGATQSLGFTIKRRVHPGDRLRGIGASLAPAANFGNPVFPVLDCAPPSITLFRSSPDRRIRRKYRLLGYLRNR